MPNLDKILDREAIIKRSKATLRNSLPRMNQIALIFNLKLSNPKHFKCAKLIYDYERS